MSGSSPLESGFAYSYCLFCRTGRCDAVAQALQQALPCRAISPKIVQRKWVAGRCEEEIRDYLPGYVFAYFHEPLEDPRKLWAQDGVIRLLGQKEDGYLLKGEDLRFAGMLLAKDGVIGILKAYEEGDRIRLTDASIPGYSGEIIRVDRHRGRAEVLIRFDDREVKIWVGFDLIEKDAPDAPAGA